ncbi:hypothetical protein EV138_4049 [Kribbella voronezhensis]|uniref:Uncharacterized protein n=1 Tax=Kribbella voronezhensis TaxID=2512212 RepID=A0A4R7TG53_9ACTN|nr:hypothetical protein [Kribbella voronezhensis]TDU90458.1 hypothetical protein EV138_4049 [Kribbella voronezhensis]
MKKLLCVTIGLAVVGLATGCGTSSKDDAGSTTQSSSAPVTTSSDPVETPTPVVTTPVGPLTAAQYQTSLTELDARLAPAIKALSTANNGDNLADAMTGLSQLLETEKSALEDVKPPAAAAAAHKALQARLQVASDNLSGSENDDAVSNAKCGGVVYTSQSLQRKLTTDLASAVALLKKAGIRFGSTLPNLGPEPADQRPSNGDIIVRSGARGSGRLQVENGTDKDVAISVVTDGQPPSKPHVMMFVQAKKTATISRIGGKYHIYYKTGKDWNAKRRQFSSDCSFSKFDQGFGKNEGWKIGLKPSLLGNASTSDVDAF